MIRAQQSEHVRQGLRRAQNSNVTVPVTVNRHGPPVILASPRLMACLTGWVPITQFVHRHLVMDTSFTVRQQKEAAEWSFPAKLPHINLIHSV